MDIKKIKLICFDCDGCLSDGIYQVDKHGNVIKSFYTRDFCGIQSLLEAGLKVLIITGSHEMNISAQINRISNYSMVWHKAIKNAQLSIIMACENKKTALEEHLKKEGMEWEEVAYMGDAENDIECMKCAAYTACPADAIDEIDADFECIKEGGKGAVHEFCNHLLREIKERQNNEDFKS